MTVEGASDVESLRRVGGVVAKARDTMLQAVVPGISTGDLDAIARKIFRAYGARSAPQLVYGFPRTTCISVNHEAAHGVPSRSQVLRSGDIVNIDVSAELDGYFADTGASIAVDAVDPRVEELLEVTRLAQADAMNAARAGHRLNEIAIAVGRRARAHNFSVIGNLCGHGVGRNIHEPPEVLNVAHPRNTKTLHEGVVIAIEPFLSLSANAAVDSGDGWTLLTDDGSLVAQYEHTVIVTNDEPIVVTAA